jgi:hypothetical protein
MALVLGVRACVPTGAVLCSGAITPVTVGAVKWYASGSHGTADVMQQLKEDA